jgi:GT2 family glycosyltransferase
LKLSVIIVNYNVRYFLEQALGSVKRAMHGIDGDVWVVDNNSADDSLPMVRTRFPETKVIANTDNTGFAVANNQAIRASTGQYVLLLNPDTVVEEDTLTKCIAFMDAHPDAGAVGVRLIDGTGAYLPESKRGFPTPWVAFCKTIGFGRLFPRSARFNGYYLGHLSPTATHEIDVLVGAFMFMRRTALDQVGLLDEAFFMYGEDIDLSYRIVQGGFKNYYLPTTSIIHYKGESTKKGSLNYVRTFYQAMIIFAEKHFTGSQKGLYIAMLKVAIWFRAVITISQNMMQRFALPLADSVLIFSGLVVLKNFWAQYFFRDPDYFEPQILWLNFPLYTAVWVLICWLSGAYDTPVSLRRLYRGLAVGTLFLAAIYGFLDLDYRTSRALILLGAVWAFLSTTLIRLAQHYLQHGNLRLGQNRLRNLAIVGGPDERQRVLMLLKQAGVQQNIIGSIAPTGLATPTDLNDLSRLDEVVRIYRINELIFCSKDLSAQEILAAMSRLGPELSYKIMPEESMSIIGSSSKNTPGELYTIDIRYNLAQAGQRRNKRVFDLAICLGLPFVMLYGLFSPQSPSANFRALLRYWLPVFVARRTWVGYAGTDTRDLPKLNTGVFTHLDHLRLGAQEPETIKRLNTLYAKDWSVWRDVEGMV